MILNPPGVMETEYKRPTPDILEVTINDLRKMLAECLPALLQDVPYGACQDIVSLHCRIDRNLTDSLKTLIKLKEVCHV